MFTRWAVFCDESEWSREVGSMAVVEKLGQKEFRRRLVAGSFPQYSNLADAIEGLRFVQADPIRSPARAQDLILRQRVAGYLAGDLEEAYPRLEVEEEFLFAYGFMPRAVWRYLRGRPSGKLGKQEKTVLDAVVELGETHPRDLDDRFGKRSVRNAWGGKSQATKWVLEDLHGRGYLRVSRREKGIRVYQAVTEPCGDEDGESRYRSLLKTTVEVFGPTGVSFLLSEIRHLNHLLPSRKRRLGLVDEMVEEGELDWLEVEGVRYLWIREFGQGLQVSDQVRILAPFDPLVRNRQRFEQAFGWEYRFEAYVPAKKRVRGYYAMPLLWRDAVIGWANAKVEGECLKLEIGYVGELPGTKVFGRALEREAEGLGLFLGLGSGCWVLG